MRRIIQASGDDSAAGSAYGANKGDQASSPQPLAEFELRVRNLRVLYNGEKESLEVILLIVGRKVGNKLIVGGEEFHGHRSNPPE